MKRAHNPAGPEMEAQGSQLMSIKADTAVLVGDLHGDLRALAVVLREAGCFGIGSGGQERAAWERLDRACSACPDGRRPRFPEAELLGSVRYTGPPGGGSCAVVFCGDVIDNRRPGVRDGKDEGYGICAYADSVELVVQTVARLCAESPRGAVTWLLGNHDFWPFLKSQSQCNAYAPVHQCTASGSYTLAFRRELIDALERANAQAIVAANGVVCCHGGLNIDWVKTVIENAPDPCQMHGGASAVTELVRTINRAFGQLLEMVRNSPRAQIPADLGPLSWALREDSLLWCRPSTTPGAYGRLFDDASYPKKWRCLGQALRGYAFAVAHTMQPDGVTIAQPRSAGDPKPVRQNERRQLEGGELLFVDTGMSRGFGKRDRIIQLVRVDRNGVLSVSRNLV